MITLMQVVVTNGLFFVDLFDMANIVDSIVETVGSNIKYPRGFELLSSQYCLLDQGRTPLDGV